MEHGVISGASPCGFPCKWEHWAAWQETAPQNPFRGDNWLQKEQPSQCSISQLQLVLQADFLSTSHAHWADTNAVFASKVQLQGSTRGWPLLTHHGLALAKTEEYPWKTPWKPPAVIPQGTAVRLSKATATQPGSAQHGNNSCHEISSNSKILQCN